MAAENGTPGNDPAEADRPEYEELVKRVSVIAKPMASRKLTKKLYKVVKKAAKAKQLRRGVKEVAKAIRKKEIGGTVKILNELDIVWVQATPEDTPGLQPFVIFAGDVSPIDVISHLPVCCEDNNVPYCYVPARLDLGIASQTKRATSVVLVKSNTEYESNYSECHKILSDMPFPV